MILPVELSSGCGLERFRTSTESDTDSDLMRKCQHLEMTRHATYKWSYTPMSSILVVECSKLVELSMTHLWGPKKLSRIFC